MKRQGHLIEKIAAMDNLLSAFYKAKKGKAGTEVILRYEKSLRPELKRLQQQIISGRVEVGNYHFFTIYDPKERQICAASFAQRTLHHAIMNICHPYFERTQIYHSYATRPGKGTYAALDRARRYQQRYRWFLKLDFHKYFDSLDHAILKRQLARQFKDPALMHIFNRIIDSYCVEPGRGVPIGNLTSQYFANHYLARLDHLIKEELSIKAYLRYMDDQALWHNDRPALLATGRRLQQYAADELELALKPFCLNRSPHGLPFLGYLLYPHAIRLGKRSHRRFINKMRAYADNLDKGIWSQADYQNHVAPLIAFTEYADAKKFRKKNLADLKRRHLL